MKKLMTVLGLTLVMLTGCFDRQAYASMQELTDFNWVAQQARADNIPIMLLFTGPNCEFCSQLETFTFNPMLRGGKYEGYAMYMRKVSDQYQTIQFNAHETILKRDLARMYRADISPTVIFVDSRGVPVADPLIGALDVQLYLGLIHQRLNLAYERMGNPMRLPVRPEDMQRPLP